MMPRHLANSENYLERRREIQRWTPRSLPPRVSAYHLNHHYFVRLPQGNKAGLPSYLQVDEADCSELLRDEHRLVTVF